MDKKQLWGDAVVEHPSGVSASVYANIQSDIYTSIYCLTFILFVLLAYKYVSRTIGTILSCCFRFSQTIKTQDNLSLEQGRIVLSIFSLFHISMIAFFFIKTFEAKLYHQLGWVIIPLLCLSLLLFYGAKYAALSFIGWVIRHSNELKIILKGVRDFFVLATVATFPLYFVTLFSWSSAIYVLTIWCVSVLTICYLLFLFRTLQYFIHFRFSIFFWILYLCALEIAPLALVYSVLITI